MVVVFYLLFVSFVGTAHVCATVSTRRSGDNLWEPLLSSHHVGTGDQTQVDSLSGKHLHPLSPITGPGY